jgi:hypothetical protein
MRILKSYERRPVSEHVDEWTFKFSDGSQETVRDTQHAEQILRLHYHPNVRSNDNAYG